MSSGAAARALYTAARLSAQDTAAAVSKKGRAAAEGVKQKAKTALQGVRDGLVKAPEVSTSLVNMTIELAILLVLVPLCNHPAQAFGMLVHLLLCDMSPA